jgi:hypothetical protein
MIALFTRGIGKAQRSNQLEKNYNQAMTANLHQSRYSELVKVPEP